MAKVQNITLPHFLDVIRRVIPSSISHVDSRQQMALFFQPFATYMKENPKVMWFPSGDIHEVIVNDELLFDAQFPDLDGFVGMEEIVLDF